MFSIYLSITMRRIVILGLLLILSGCGKNATTDLVKLIPKDADWVLKIDARGLAAKSIKLDELLREISKGSSSESDKSSSEADKKSEKNKMQAELLSTIDFVNGTAYVWIDYEKSVSESVIVALLPLSDVAKFEKLVKENAKEIKKEGELSYSLIENKVTVAWKGNTAIMLVATNNELINSTIKKISELKDENLLVNADEKFKSNINTAHDVLVWIDIDKITGAAATNTVLIPGDYKIKDATIVSTLDMNKGEILLNAKTYLSDSDVVELKDLYRSGLSSAIAGLIPGGTLFAFASAFDLSAVMKLYLKMNPDAKADMKLQDENFKKSIGMTTEEIINIFTGEIAVLFEKLGNNDELNKLYPSAGLLSELLVGIGIKDKAGFDKLMNSEMGKMAALKNGVRTLPLKDYGANIELYVIESDKSVFFTISKELRDKISSKSVQPDPNMVELLTKNANVLYLDVAKAKKEAKNTLGAMAEAFEIEKFPLETFTLTTGPIAKEMKATLRITTTKKDEYSAKTLADFIQEVSKKYVAPM